MTGIKSGGGGVGAPPHYLSPSAHQTPLHQSMLSVCSFVPIMLGLAYALQFRRIFPKRKAVLVISLSSPPNTLNRPC